MLTTEDKQEVRIIVREEMLPLVVRLEHFESDIRGMFTDIKGVLDDAVNLPPGVEVLEADVAILKGFSKP